MKQVLVLLLTLVATHTPGQHAAPSGTFNSQKKTAHLPTGITMKYVERGNAGGEALVLLHGLSDTGRSFQSLIEEVIAAYPNLRIIVPDLRGHGDTSMPPRNRCAGIPEECFTPADFAADVIALLDHLAIPSAHIIGHSMGSAVAQEIALNQPERAISLILIGTFVYGRDVSLFNDFLMSTLYERMWRPALETQPDFSWPADAYFVKPADIGRGETAYLRQHWVTEAGADDAFLDAVHQETSEIRMGTWVGATRALVNVDNRAAMENLSVPTLVLWSTQDNAFPMADQGRVVEALAGAARANNTLVVYKTYGKKPLGPGARQTDLGHNPHWSASKQVAEDIISFVRTGFPTTNLPYLDPKNPDEVLEQSGAATIRTWGGMREQASNAIR